MPKQAANQKTSRRSRSDKKTRENKMLSSNTLNKVSKGAVVVSAAAGLVAVGTALSDKKNRDKITKRAKAVGEKAKMGAGRMTEILTEAISEEYQGMAHEVNVSQPRSGRLEKKLNKSGVDSSHSR